MALDTPRKEYGAAVARWQRCRDVIDGEDAVKSRCSISSAADAAVGLTGSPYQYLPRLSISQTPEEYASYVARALFYNGTARTHVALVGLVFWKDSQVKAPEKVKPHLDDITNTGMPTNDFAQEMLSEIVGVGRFGVLIDYPDATTTAAADLRPYWVSYKAEQIIRWAETKINGLYEPSLVVLAETVEEPDPKDPYCTVEVKQIRVLKLTADATTKTGYRYEQEIYQRKAGQSDLIQIGGTITPLRQGKPLDFIPFVFVNASSLQTAIEKPPLLDLVNTNLSHFRSSADLEHGEHFLALPTPWVVGAKNDAVLPLGPTVVWKLSGPNAQAGLLEFKGEGLSQLEKALARKQEMMATLGARLIEQARASNETAESVKARNAATHATLAKIVSAVSLAMTKLLRWHTWWFGLTVPDADVTVELNRDFVEVTLSADDVKSELLRWQAGGCSFETFYYNMTRGGRTRPGVSFEDEQIAIDAEEAVRQQNNIDAGLNPDGSMPPQPKPAPGGPAPKPGAPQPKPGKGAAA